MMGHGTMAFASTATTTTTNGLPDLEVGEHTPLLPKPPQQDALVVLHDGKDDSHKETIVASVAAVSFATSLLTLLWADASSSTAYPSLYVSGVIGTLVAPYAAWQQHKMTETNALVETNTHMSEQVQQLQEENVQLQRQVQELEENVRSLQVMEETLEAVRGVKGKSITVLEQQLDESKKILHNMMDQHNSAQAELLQTLLSVLLARDLDDDDDHADNWPIINDQELEYMIDRMERINGVDLNDTLLRQTIVQNGRSVNAVMEVIRNLLSDDIPKDQNIFIIHNKLQ